MAEKRMFTKKITTSDDFIAMPHSSQNLYFHLNMEADDEGFVNGVKRIMRTINANEDDLKILITKRFVLVFESGVIVIKHWKLHNTIRSDRWKPTDYIAEKSQLLEKNNGVYTECLPNDNQMSTIGMHSIDKIRLDKYSIDKISIEDVEQVTTPKRKSKFVKPTKEQLENYITEKELKVDAQMFLDHYDSVGWYVGSKKMVDWEATVRKWNNNNFSKPTNSYNRKVRVENELQYKKDDVELSVEELEQIKKNFERLK